MIKDIIDNNITYARIVRASYVPKDVEFYTQNSDEIQFGIINYAKNHKTGAHYHNHLKTKTNQTDEIMIFQEGSARIDFYSDKGSYLKSCEVFKGDIVIIYKGGHNIFFSENTKVIKIQSGAYDEEQSTTRIIGANNMDLIIDKD